MLVKVAEIVALKVNDRAAAQTFQMKMLAALFRADILITGGASVLKRVSANLSAGNELVEIAVYGCLSDSVALVPQQLGNLVGGKMLVRIFF